MAEPAAARARVAADGPSNPLSRGSRGSNNPVLTRRGGARSSPRSRGGGARSSTRSRHWGEECSGSNADSGIKAGNSSKEEAGTNYMIGVQFTFSSLRALPTRVFMNRRFIKRFHLSLFHFAPRPTRLFMNQGGVHEQLNFTSVHYCFL